ncbi:MAG: molybdopterin-dependent oxidoreductase, partial [Burkholderiaceae bacterium]
GSAIDFQNTEFAIFLGRSMGVSGYSLNSIGRKLAQARTDRGMKYLVVDPLLRATSVDLKDKNARWLPITPGGDVPFLFGLMHEIFSTETFRRAHLESPHAEAAKAVGELHYSNASHLVVRNPGHPLNNQFLRADVVGLGDAKTALVIDKASGQIASASASPAGSLFFKGTVKAKDGSSIAVESALSIFRAHVYAQPLDHYAQASGVSVADIKAVAKEFTSHGRKVAIERSTSVSYTDSYTAGYAVLLALVLVGAVDAKGGSVSFGGTHQGMKGPYTLGSFAGAKEAKSLGITINREGCYEQSSEFARKKAAGQNPYPSDQPWATVGRGLCNTAEMLVAHANASPYRLDAYFNWRANPLYMASALYHEVRESLHDPKRLGLYVAIDCFMTESVMPADYVIPDLHF